MLIVANLLREKALLRGWLIEEEGNEVVFRQTISIELMQVANSFTDHSLLTTVLRDLSLAS